MLNTKPVIVFMGTYPPRECGIATFNQDLLNASRKVLENKVKCLVVAFNRSANETRTYPSEVAWTIDQNDTLAHENLAREFNSNHSISGVVLQHEYGIYGGEDGENILKFIENYKKPLIVTLHTVLPDPTVKMKDITRRVIEKATRIVVLTQNSKNLLESIYPESEGKVYVIPHGVHATSFSGTEESKRKLNLKNRTILSTFGLLSRGKGIEYVIQSLPKVIKEHPEVTYLVLGETHPIVRRNEGEKYRRSLIKLVDRLGLNRHVIFYDEYLTLADLINFLKATDIYISTSINPNQAVSGTLSYALGTGRAVVSTSFPQALEIITPENGRLVPLKDPRSFSEALNDLLSDSERLSLMHKNAYESTREMLWENVAKQYYDLLALSIFPPINLWHLKKMTDQFGLFQFSKHSAPLKKFGYTLDDNARALIACNLIIKNKFPLQVRRLIEIYLNFIETCQLPNGKFVNYISHKDKRPTSQNHTEDIEEANSRAIWGLSEIVNEKYLGKKTREKCKQILLKTFPNLKDFKHARSNAFLIKALSNLLTVFPKEKQLLMSQIEQCANFLMEIFTKNSSHDWMWFETQLGYNNAILPEGLFIAWDILRNKKYLKTAKQSLQFLIEKTFTGNMYLPIGHSDWYKKDGKRSNFDQQPEDPASMIIALATAYKITHNEAYRNLAYKCFSWFLGNNVLGKPVYNFLTGGAYDGLHPDRVNQNQGAEALVSYLLARTKVEELKNYANSANS